jgi:hypothetical protein
VMPGKDVTVQLSAWDTDFYLDVGDFVILDYRAVSDYFNHYANPMQRIAERVVIKSVNPGAKSFTCDVLRPHNTGERVTALYRREPEKNRLFSPVWGEFANPRGASNAPNNVHIDHNTFTTAIPGYADRYRGIIYFAGAACSPQYGTPDPRAQGFEFTNNVVNLGSDGITGEDPSGVFNYGVPENDLLRVLNAPSFLNNAFYDNDSFPSGFRQGMLSLNGLPADNNFYVDHATGTSYFENWNGGNGGNYQLVGSGTAPTDEHPWTNAGSDGTDIGNRRWYWHTDGSGGPGP